MDEAYEPEKLFARYKHQCDQTYSNRIKVPVSDEMKSWPNIRRGLIMMGKIVWKIGVLGDYKWPFWRFAWSQLRRGEIENFIAVALVAHHLIMFARAASRGHQNASNYSIRLREASVPAE
jgi:hopanoid C-2 methylase